MNPLVIFCSAMAGGFVSGFVVWAMMLGYYRNNDSNVFERGRKRGKYTEVSPSMIRKETHYVGKTRRP